MTTKGMAAPEIASLIERITNASKNHEITYEGDVCERCGAVVNEDAT